MNAPIDNNNSNPVITWQILSGFSSNGFLSQHHENTMRTLPENVDRFTNEINSPDEIDFFTGLMEFMKHWPGL